MKNKEIFDKYPECLYMGLTTKCNLHCYICNREGFKGEEMAVKNLFKLKSAIRHAKTIDPTSWGEPLTHPHFHEIIEFILNNNPNSKCLKFSTNGSLLNSKLGKLLKGNLQGVVVSLNAATPEVYNRDMKNGDFNRTIKRLTAFVNHLSVKDLQAIKMHFVANTRNYKDIINFVKLTHSLGLSNVSIAPMQIKCFDHYNASILNIPLEFDKVVREAAELALQYGINFYCPVLLTSKKDGFFKTKETIEFSETACIDTDACTDLYTKCYISPNGEVAPCCFSGGMVMGNVFKTSFEDVWFGSRYQKMRAKRPWLKACLRCVQFSQSNQITAHISPSVWKQEGHLEKIKNLEIKYKEALSQLSIQEKTNLRQLLFEGRINQTRNAYIKYIEEVKPKSIYIWGTSGCYHKLRDIFKSVQIAAFIDPDPEKSGTILDNAPIISPQDLLKKEEKPIFICSVFKKDIVDQILFEFPKFVNIP